MPEEWHVKYDGNSQSRMWCVLRCTALPAELSNNNELVKMFSTQKEAWWFSQMYARKWRGVAVLHSKEGKVREMRIYNRKLRREMGLSV